MNLRTNLGFAVMVAICAAADLPAQSVPAADDSRIVHGIGEPSDRSHVSFAGNADGNSVIEKVVVKPGDTVKAGDLLMKEDSSQAEAELAIYKAAAEATGAITEAQVTIDSKTKLANKYAKVGIANQQNVELINAELERDVATARLKQATEEQTKNQLSCERQQIKVDHMSLKSPIDGIVESVNLYAGEVVDANSDKQGACYIIKTDPLWIELNISARQANKLALHDKVDVAFPDAPTDWRDGEVIFLDPSVEYVGQTRTVRVSIANPDHQPTGLPMIVRLPEKAAARNDSLGSTN